jgi:hypothetical protein
VSRVMPLSRLCGNVALSFLTRLATGYPHLFDSQCGYTAANRRALGTFLGGPLFPRYGYPNHLLALLGAAGAAVVDVPVRPVYGPDWRSGIRIPRVIGPVSSLLLRAFVRRMARRFLPRRAPEPIALADSPRIAV